MTAINTNKPLRKFLPETLEINSAEAIKPFFESLLERSLDTEERLMRWLSDSSELESVLAEDVAWRYIAMTCDTANEEKANHYKHFVTEIQPNLAAYGNQLNEMLLASPIFQQLPGEDFSIMRKRLQKDVDLFREENIALQAEIEAEKQQYGAISGAMSVTIDGQEMTLQKAGARMENPDRTIREEAYRKINERRHQDAEKLDELFSSLVKKRHQLALNAGFDNFRDYSFVARGRFDYTPQDCFDFHNAVEKALVPLVNETRIARKKEMKLDELRPWDLAVDASGKPALKPFDTAEELMEKGIECFRRLDPMLGECLEALKKLNRVDLDSRKGKAPGGYNYPLMETGVPFVFMNATSTIRDLVTLMHEGGHAVHSILTKDLPLASFKELTPEIAELASMSMELISMDHWDLFFEHEEDLKRAKANHIESLLDVMPWIALIDKFQHWIYENPQHTVAERDAAWLDMHKRFSSEAIDWRGLEHFRTKIWHRQLHVFELPFYYIEYGIAQLGAIAVWKRYRENPKDALKAYTDALRLGYTKSIPAMYGTAGVQFNFSAAYIQELMDFVRAELAMVEA